MTSRAWQNCLVLFVVSTVMMGAFAKDTALLKPVYDSDTLFLQTDGDFSSYTLKVMGQDGSYFAMEFDGNEMPYISAQDNNLADGLYTYELVASPRRAMKAAGQDRNSYQDAELPQGKKQSGSFRVAGGEMVTSDQVEVTKGDETTGNIVTDADEGRDQVIADDLIVQGSICAGFDCVNNENFGADTLRLKENNLRIHFDDTSSTGSFPSNDWRITANDQSSGGASYLSVDDVTGGKTPFKVVAGAPSNSLLVYSSGNVGLGTATPVLDLHIVNGNTPAMRLEQDGSSGFSAQTWDVAGNETNFFVRDVTGGSKLPFKIQPGADNNTLYVSNASRIGIGTASPSEKLDVNGNATFTGSLNATSTGTFGDAVTISADSTAALNVTNTSTTTGNRNLLVMTNKGQVRTQWNNTADSNRWDLRVGGSGQFVFTENNGTASTVFTLFDTGNATLLGTLTQSSDVNLKENIEPINPLQVLDSVLELPITTWNYKSNCDDTRHMGPMAQDFYEHFRLNNSETGLTSIDTSGVALGAIQGLAQLLNEKNAQIEALQAKLDAQEARLQAIEAALQK